MARTLNNEVDVLNIASLDNDIKDSFTRAMITEDVNTTSAAARRYLEGEYFIHNDRYLYKALEDIAAGTPITPDVNAEVVTVSEELVRLFAQSPEGIFEILSNVENTSVASKNYAEGSQFIWTDKKLYEATADIASGSTFVVGTNVKLADNLTSQIDTLKNETSDIVNVLGAKNIFPNKLTNQTFNGVTYTKENDGSIRLDGTLTAQRLVLISNDYRDTDVNWIKQFEGKEMILSGGLEHVTVALLFYDANDTAIGSTIYTPYGGGETRFIVPSGIYTYMAWLNQDTSTITFDGDKIFPMIRPASIEDDTYVPRAMTNMELTLNLEYVELKGATTSNGLKVIGDYGKVLPIGVVPITKGLEVTGILLNEYGVYYARTNKNSTEITVGVFRKRIKY